MKNFTEIWPNFMKHLVIFLEVKAIPRTINEAQNIRSPAFALYFGTYQRFQHILRHIEKIRNNFSRTTFMRVESYCDFGPNANFLMNSIDSVIFESP